nr:prenyltransferase/squalene oxidase repeat-containing protein [uncultured Desulfobacter sp.]
MYRKHLLQNVLIVVSVLLYSSHTTYADITQAAIYIESNQNDNGSWGNDPAITYFETVEAVKILSELGLTGASYQRGVNFISDYAIGGVEDNAHKVNAVVDAGRNIDEELDIILNAQNSDGGFGFDQGYESDVYHTALALSALNKAGVSDTGVLGTTVSYLVNQQNTNGAFSLSDDHESIYLTALVAETLHLIGGQSSQVNLAIQWLLTMQNTDGGFGENASSIFESSRVYKLLHTVSPDLQEADEVHDYIVSQQYVNGSYNNDIYQTATAAQCLLPAYEKSQLKAGLNLFGYPTGVAYGYTSYNLIADLGNETDVEKIQRYNPTTNVFETTYFDGSVVSGDQFDIQNGEGYYVYMKGMKDVYFKKRSGTADLSLYEGTNLVSFLSVPEITSYELIEYLGGSDEVISIQKFNHDTGCFETTTYYEGTPSGQIFDIKNAEAYLVYMKTGKDITDLFTPPNIEITSHADGETVYNASVDISGTISDNTILVTVNGINAVLGTNTFTASGLALQEGENAIEAVATAENGMTDTHTISLNYAADIDYAISSGGEVEDVRPFQFAPSYYGNITSITAGTSGPSFISLVLSGAGYTATNEIEITYRLQVESGAASGIYDYQVEFGALDGSGNPISPVYNNIYQFKVRILRVSR